MGAALVRVARWGRWAVGAGMEPLADNGEGLVKTRVRCGVLLFAAGTLAGLG